MTDNQVDVDYRNLVEQAYIQPIKSVLAIDDQYRALDSYLDENFQSSDKDHDLPRQKQVLEMVRSRSWLADMHDGQSSGQDDPLFSRLHQCDLLLLDYHLDPAEHNDPSKALEILKVLNSNHHFNLVIVYTSADDLLKVQQEIFFRLSKAHHDILDIDFTHIQQLFEQWSDDGYEFLDELLESITNHELYSILLASSDLDQIVETQFAPVKESMNQQGCTIPDSISIIDFYLYLLNQKIKILQEKGEFSGEGIVLINNGDQSPVWLRTNKLFVAIISKEEVKPYALPDALLSALENWRPTTHRLLLSKIKSELDDNGQAFEEEVLKCDYTNVGWLKEFSEKANGYDLTVSRLMEGLNNSVVESGGLKGYSDMLKAYLTKVGIDQSISNESKFQINLTRELDKINVYKSLNSYIGTRQVDGKHLATGHVIEWENDTEDSNDMLLCLTPACDLVPDRINDRGWKTDIAPYLPVKVIRLIEQTNEKKYLQKVNSDPVVVLTIDGTTKVYLAAKSKKAVFHEQVFASQQGIFDMAGDTRVVELNRTLLTKPETCASATTEGATLKTYTKRCRVVAQLRYEYALNLLQLLGHDLTRIGLDYVDFKSG